MGPQEINYTGPDEGGVITGLIMLNQLVVDQTLMRLMLLNLI